ncbi:hypothetical protein EVG20_g6040 [Dentipellis fragilis]|uniref:PPPDE domain-containing protein n=1 Tax=Dentipellis fragilis TaxID=205917 RepID=A0A4Y9YQU1_9AGAM|nr:hypothetical protein EVG20_g6040 [Dentipellis fragilis]
MATLVKLYVYDLSNGLAKAMSLQLTGKQINGIWHTSVVVFGKELFYGQGIDITRPGGSHLGQPLQIVDMGETAIDEPTFEEYLSEMRQHYTADKYHLLDFNCNSFTNDCVGFLTGGSIPSWIKDLPSDFLSTPFGASLRPTIDSMYRRPSAGARAPAPTPAQPTPDLTSALLQAVATRAASSTLTNGPVASGSGSSTPSTATLAAPIHVSTNPASFHSTLKSHRSVVAFFTSTTCAPCRMIEPVFEELARAKTRGEGKIAFVKVDIGAGMGQLLASEYKVNATPTFQFFLDGKKVHELKGVNAPELRSQVDLLLYEAFPPHPHTSLNLAAVSQISLDPILFSQVPALDTVQEKLFSFIYALGQEKLPNRTQLKDSMSQTVFPWLQLRFGPNRTKSPPAPTAILITAFAQMAATLVQVLPVGSLFPFLDVWRLAILDPSIASASLSPLTTLLTNLSNSSTIVPRATRLTLLRVLSNALGSPVLARSLLAEDKKAKSGLTTVLVQTLLHQDRLVRVAAASVAFNASAWVQRGRVASLQGNDGKADGISEGEEDGDWDVELVSAIVEALGNETESEDVVHRLTATLAMFLRLSPFYATQVVSLLDVLGAQAMLKAKLSDDSVLKIQKKEVRALVEEVADRLCT